MTFIQNEVYDYITFMIKELLTGAYNTAINMFKGIWEDATDDGVRDFWAHANTNYTLIP